MNNDLLNITNLNVKFMINQNVIEVLKDINISIEKQDTVAIIGESGSGKTILAKTICGILPNNLYEICGKINRGKSRSLRFSPKRCFAPFGDPLNLNARRK